MDRPPCRKWADPAPRIDSDRLCLALVAYRTYFQCPGPRGFTGGLASLRDLPTSPPANHELSNLFSRAFVDSAPRPAAAERSAALQRLTDQLPALTASSRGPGQSILLLSICWAARHLCLGARGI